MSEGIASSLVCVKCEDEPEAAKVIIVERDGRPARLFAAATWEVLTSGVEAGDLVLRDKNDYTIAQLGARMWDSVCDAEVILPAGLYSSRGKKLAIALDALRAIGDAYETGTVAHDFAHKALDEIYADLEDQ